MYYGKSKCAALFHFCADDSITRIVKRSNRGRLEVNRGSSIVRFEFLDEEYTIVGRFVHACARARYFKLMAASERASLIKST